MCSNRAATRANILKTWEKHDRVISIFAGILQTLEVLSKVSHLPYKEGVAGSTPASPTYISPANNGIYGNKERAGKCILALLLQPVWGATRDMVPANLFARIRILFCCPREGLLEATGQTPQRVGATFYSNLRMFLETPVIVVIVDANDSLVFNRKAEARRPPKTKTQQKFRRKGSDPQS